MPRQKPFGFLKNFPAPPYATGVDGDLIVLNGQTVTLSGGGTYQYENIDIQSGGILNIDNTSLDMTQILAKKSFNIDGTINCRGIENNGYSRSGSFVSGISYSYAISQRQGGNGGGGNSEVDGAKALGGAAANGYGGGGGGGAAQSFGHGRGGTNNGSGSTGYWRSSTISSFSGVNPGGSGNFTQGNGHTASTVSPQYGGARGGEGGGSGGGGGGGNGQDKGSGGGGGGNKGLHGKMLYLMCSFSITGTGLVNVSGSNGFNGGNGGNRVSGESGAGGGGGGGAGGSGGHLYIQALSFQPSRSFGGGSGGAAGARGADAGNSGGENGAAAQGGQSGNSGSYILETNVFRTS